MTPAASSGPAPRVLVIEDDDDVRALLANVLELAGCEVTEAETGERGVELALGDPPDVVVLDLVLPGIDGHQVLARLRADERSRACRVVVTSVLDREALPDDVDAVLPKPFGRQDVIQVLRSLAGEAPSRR